jgi:transcriptional regulator with XRE-family HTH domain
LAELGQRIRQARLQRGVTGAQLAEYIGVSANYISELERGIKKNPSMQVIAGMAEVLHVPVDYFFGVTDKSLHHYIPADLSSYVREQIIEPYGTPGKAEGLSDKEIMDALMQYVRVTKEKLGS